MDSISQILQKERYLPHDLNTKYYSVLMYRNGASVSFVCRKYHISKRSLMRWNKKYDGTKESLIDISHRPKTPHPNSHTEKIKVIHHMDDLCNKLDIIHHKIRPRTPRHNGKVERSHRSDNERFYSHHSFYSLEDLRVQGTAYLKKSIIFL